MLNPQKIFWSLYGRYVWDDQSEQSWPSKPPEFIVNTILNRNSNFCSWVLDAGCGTGNYSIALAKAGFHVIGMDYSRGMIEKANEKIPNKLNGYLFFQQSDLNKPLEFPDLRFDHIICMSVLQAISNPESVLMEFYRLLKPKGTIILSLPKQDSVVITNSIYNIIKYRVNNLKRRSFGKIFLVVIKSFGDRFSKSFRWNIPTSEMILYDAGFKTIYLEDGQQILIIAEKNAA